MRSGSFFKFFFFIYIFLLSAQSILSYWNVAIIKEIAEMEIA